MEADGDDVASSSRPDPAPSSATPGGRAPISWPEVAALALLVPWNLAGNLLVPATATVPFALACAGSMVLLARRAGATWPDLGLARDRVRSGLRVGSLAAMGVTGVVVAVSLAPAADWLLADGRFEAVSTGGMLYTILVRIPLATALAEEIAFRGVLLGLLLRRTTRLRAVLLSSAVFGLWHVVPGVEALDTSPAGDLAGGVALVVGAVAGQVLLTAAAGLVFCWLRLRGGHVFAPALAHWALNASGFAVGWLLVQGVS